MKKPYIKPQLEVYTYQAEEGYAVSAALHKDFVLIEGDDRSTRRASDEITEYTNEDEGYFETGTWLD